MGLTCLFTFIFLSSLLPASVSQTEPDPASSPRWVSHLRPQLVLFVLGVGAHVQMVPFFKSTVTIKSVKISCGPTLTIPFQPHNNLMRKRLPLFPFTDEKTEAHKGEGCTAGKWQ